MHSKNASYPHLSIIKSIIHVHQNNNMFIFNKLTGQFNRERIVSTNDTGTPGYPDFCLGRIELDPFFFYTLHKNELQVDHRSKYKS